MEIQLLREELLRPLQGVAGVVERRQTLPILGNVRIEAENSGAIRLTTTDMEVEMTADIGDGAREAGTTTVSARKLLDICRALPDGSEIHVSEQQGRLQLRAGSSLFTLGTLDAQEFPQVGSIEDGLRFSLRREVLEELLKRTSFAMAQQDVRHYLTGLLLEVGPEKLRAVCTDGHRLALCDAAQPPEVDGERSVIVPRKAVLELERLLSQAEETVEVTLSARYARFALGTLGITTKLIDAQFPDYNRVVPSDTRFNILVDRGPLREAVTRVAILANEKFRGVRLEAGTNMLKLTTHNPESEEAEETVSARYAGESFVTAFNATYLQEALGALDAETVNFCFTASDSSTLIQQPDTERLRYVVMPIRL
ncbi:MAG: DNA polymerase III subunit beta [Gammaproteobacteria bacterium]|nr:DNA polymerase III subunit beta [Gammaproteobacteria bacterium]